MPTGKNTSCKPSQIVPAIANLQQPSIADQQNQIANQPEPSSLIDQSMMSGRPKYQPQATRDTRPKQSHVRGQHWTNGNKCSNH